MIPTLYEPFRHWADAGSVYILSDTHFDDKDCKLMNENSGTIKNILLGIGGGFVGGLVFNLLGLSANGLIGSLLVSTVGACICIWAGRKLFK